MLIDSVEHLVKSYIGAYFSTLKSRQYKPLNTQWKLHKQKLLKEIKHTDQWHLLRDLGILMIYYGTPVKAQEICDFQVDHVVLQENRVKLKLSRPGQDRYMLLDEETTEIMSEYLEYIEPSQIQLFLDDDHQPLKYHDIFLLANRYPNEVLTSEMSSFFPIYSQSDYEIIPTPLRLNVLSRYSGKGITIAFIDSGFYPHPDLTTPNNRILAYVNVPEPDRDDFDLPEDNSWHGMQTSVAAAGNGYLSNGLYKAIAYNANIVLLKACDSRGEIKTEYMIKALKWVLENHLEYNIKIVNISLGESRAQSYLDNALDQMAEAVTQAGVTVVVAAGNDGLNPGRNIITPPASAPSVITVGGFDDNNRFDRHNYNMYHSSYGPTIDGLMKPELIAPGIWVAAPILPKSPLYREAEVLSHLSKVPDSMLMDLIRENMDDLPFEKEILDESTEDIRNKITYRLQAQKIVGVHYQHVDGTSFSAPIICSIIAQMLEANPGLSPHRIKEILLATTDRVFNIPVEQQGHGLVHPRKSVKEAENDRYRKGIKRFSSPYVIGRKVTFYYESPDAESVAVAGDFTNWESDIEYLQKRPGTHLWELEKEFPFKGVYAYKLIVNGEQWMHDPECINVEPDGYGGFNTRLNLFLD